MDAGFDLISPPRFGIAAGLLGAAAPLAVLAATGQESVIRAWLVDLAAIWPGSEAPVWVGALTHFAAGAILGALHAACQQRTTIGGLFAVGIFYGFIIWLTASLLLTGLFRLELAELRQWSGLGWAEVYGLVLAGITALRSKTAVPSQAIPLD